VQPGLAFLAVPSAPHDFRWERTPAPTLRPIAQRVMRIAVFLIGCPITTLVACPPAIASKHAGTRPAA
jgi:hypothetical protein